LARIEDAGTIASVQRLLADQSVIIADGHHRYEVALEYRRERAQESAVGPNGTQAADPGPAAYKMMLFVDAQDPGLEILAIHRLVQRLPISGELLRARLESFFEVEQVGSPERLAQALAGETARLRFGLALANELMLAVVRPGVEAALPWPARTGPQERALEVALLHHVVLEHLVGIGPDQLATGDGLTYTHYWDAALEGVREGRAQAALLLPPIARTRFWDAIRAGVILPRKSTHFRPKPVSGLLFAELT
jgi:uncharacterized protein (DUF1015 family)